MHTSSGLLIQEIKDDLIYVNYNPQEFNVVRINFKVHLYIIVNEVCIGI